VIRAVTIPQRQSRDFRKYHPERAFHADTDKRALIRAITKKTILIKFFTFFKLPLPHHPWDVAFSCLISGEILCPRERQSFLNDFSRA